VRAGDEPSLHPGLLGAGAYQHGIRPPAHEQLDGLDDQGLPRAGLAGEGGHAAVEDQLEVGDDPEVTDVELDQHQRRPFISDPPRRTWS
jgi:hypothetical protein